LPAYTTSRFDLALNFSVAQASYQRRGIDTAQTGKPFPLASLTGVVPEPSLGIIIDKLWRKRLRLGVTVTLPRLAGAAWPENVRDSDGQTVLGPTRYYVTDAEIFYVYLQAGASIAVHPTFALGASVNVLFGSINIHQHLDLLNQDGLRDVLPCSQNPLGCENPTFSTPVAVTGHGVSVGGAVGALWQPVPQLRIGVAYFSPVRIDYQATVEIDASKLAAFARQVLPSYQTVALNAEAVAHVLLPQRVHVGIAVAVHPRVELAALLRWNNTSATDIIQTNVIAKSATLLPDAQTLVSPKHDEWTAALRVVGRVRERWKLGFGIEYVSRTVDDEFVSPSAVDFDSFTFTLAAQVRVWNHLYLGAMFAQALVIPRTITASAFANDSPSPFNKPDPGGSYWANAERFGLDLAAAF
jgi:long-subunit fatty acid transport protein